MFLLQIFMCYCLFYISNCYIITRKVNGDTIAGITNCTLFGGTIISEGCECVNGTFVTNHDKTTAHICYKNANTFNFGANTIFENKSDVYFIPYDKQEKRWNDEIYHSRIVDMYSRKFVKFCQNYDAIYYVIKPVIIKDVTQSFNVEIIKSSTSSEGLIKITNDNGYFRVRLYPNSLSYDETQGRLFYLEISSIQCKRILLVKFEGNNHYTNMPEPKHKTPPVPPPPRPRPPPPPKHKTSDVTSSIKLIVGSIAGIVGIVLIIIAAFCFVRLRRREKLNLMVPPPYPSLKYEPKEAIVSPQYTNTAANLDLSPIYETIRNSGLPEHKYQEIHKRTKEGVIFHNKINEEDIKKSREEVEEEEEEEEQENHLYVNRPSEPDDEIKKLDNESSHTYQNTVDSDIVIENSKTEIFV